MKNKNILPSSNINIETMGLKREPDILGTQTAINLRYSPDVTTCENCDLCELCERSATKNALSQPCRYDLQ